MNGGITVRMSLLVTQRDAVKRSPKAMNGGIIAYCPACAPELNPAGAEWKSFRKAAGNRLYGAQKGCRNPPERCREGRLRL